MKYKYNGQVYDVSIKALDSMPIGSIILFAGEEDSIPTGWMICDGRVVAKEGLEELYDVIGAIYGTPPSNSEFYLPDLRGKVPVGVDANDTDFNTIGKTGGSKELQQHNHGSLWQAGSGAGTGTGDYAGMPAVFGSYAIPGMVERHTLNTGTGDSGNLQPYLTLNYIIKAYNTTPTMASIVDDYSTSTQDGYSCDYVNDCNTYSTNEVDTGKTWVGGRKIYRKVINNVSITSGTAKQVNTGLTNVLEVVSLYGQIKMGTQEITIPSYYGASTFITANYEYRNPKNVIFYDCAGLSGTAYFVIEYTKTTD